MRKIGLLGGLLLLLVGTSFKTKSFEGTIKYTVDYHADYGVTKYPQEMNVSIKGDIVRVDISLPFAEMSDIINCKKKTHVKLCTVDGIKYCVKDKLKDAALITPAAMAKDSTKTIKDVPCIFGRINTKEVRFVVFAAEKYAISKNITSSGSELPYRLFFPQKEFSGKVPMRVDMFDNDGETTYLVESIAESQLKDSDISPSLEGYSEVTQEALGKIISNYLKGMH